MKLLSGVQSGLCNPRATGRIEFEDCKMIGIQSDVRDCLQSTCSGNKVDLVDHPRTGRDKKKGCVG